MAFEIAVIVSTFERPGHLLRCLTSLEMQRGIAGRFEVVVTDDGSRDDTLQQIRSFARHASFSLRWITQDHHGFRLARCRNAGIATTSAPYLLFTDGDCVLPPDHLRIHLEERRPGRVVAGDCLRIGRDESDLITTDVIRHGELASAIPAAERWRLFGKATRALAYQALRVPMRPRLTGCNIAAWRHDLEQINGFDERFIGWGLEDRDLQRRLERIGVRPRSVIHRTAALHLWHTPAQSFVRNCVGTQNLSYYQRPDFSTYCIDGLVKESDRQESTQLSVDGRLPARIAA